MLNQFRNIPKARWWLAAWVALAIASAIPVFMKIYHRIDGVTREARVTLIVQHRLWELHPEYQGTPQMWTRVASRVLTDRQLMRRVREKYGDIAVQVELEYRRDLTIAQAEAAAGLLALWAAPLAALFALGYALVRRPERKRPEPPPRPPSYDDARYRP